MKIEIDYNGAFSVCRIEPVDEPDKMVNFNDADIKSQTYALGAFHAVEEHWRREKQLERFKKHPVMRIKRELQVRMQNLDEIQNLANEGVIQQWSFDVSRTPTISIVLNDNYTTVEDFGWLMQDYDGRWWGMSSGCHRMLMEYNKIIKQD